MRAFFLLHYPVLLFKQRIFALFHEKINDFVSYIIEFIRPPLFIVEPKLPFRLELEKQAASAAVLLYSVYM